MSELSDSSVVRREEVGKQISIARRKGVSRGREVMERQVYHSPLDRSDCVFFGGLALVTALSVATRLYKITEPTHVA